MDNIDSIDEILEFAITREIEAYQLYMYIAKRAENYQIRKVCEDFAQEELEHKAKLELEVMKTCKVVRDFDISLYTDDAGEPIDMDYKELLVFAIKKEEKSIKLYSDLAAIVKDITSRETLLALVEEEKQHKQRFETEYKVLKDI